MLGLMARARLVLTDSGGVQEETTALAVPCLTMRDNTERPITVEQGTNLIVGRDRERIRAARGRRARARGQARTPTRAVGRADRADASPITSRRGCAPVPGPPEAVTA